MIDFGSPKGAPGATQEPPRAPQDRPKMPQDRFKTTENSIYFNFGIDFGSSFLSTTLGSESYAAVPLNCRDSGDEDLVN